MADFKPFSREEQIEFLNRMLEAERAGAKALMCILEASPRRGEAWAALRRVHSDEAHNCVLLASSSSGSALTTVMPREIFSASCSP